MYPTGDQVSNYIKVWGRHNCDDIIRASDGLNRFHRLHGTQRFKHISRRAMFDDVSDGIDQLNAIRDYLAPLLLLWAVDSANERGFA